MSVSDNKYFTCSESSEIEYVASQYPGQEEIIKEFLEKSCKDGTIYYMTHEDIHKLIKEKLNMDRFIQEE
ncbi:hypothetical protein [Fusobacterium sp.]|uniref:hypothetical protein n=1 Tax=Fusobacterium sp. TaxID=68766 RepID=UPI00261A1457|nr:hypothetical protein [Fusobacterium sp.]